MAQRKAWQWVVFIAIMALALLAQSCMAMRQRHEICAVDSATGVGYYRRYKVVPVDSLHYRIVVVDSIPWCEGGRKQ